MVRKLTIIIYIFMGLAGTLLSQTCGIDIRVVDAHDKTPLDFVAISFKISDKKNWDMEFTDQDGWFRTQQKIGMEIKYNMTYLGYHEQSVTVTCANDTKLTYIIEMTKSAVKLGEVIITDKFPAIIEKRDTVIYSVAEFTSGNEEKLKEVLNKLPGIHVDRNNIVTFNGEKVTELLVENDKFFSGDPGLAVKYIPANAVERVEVLERHNQIKVLRRTSINDKLTLNIRLKKDRKKLIFGELVAGTNINDRHILHNSAFYYSPTFTANNISDFKTTQDEVINQSELSRIIGPDMDNYDPKSRPASFEQITRLARILSSGNVFDQQSMFGIQQLRYKTKNQVSIEGIVLGYDKTDESALTKIISFPDRATGNQYSSQNTNNTTRYKHADIILSSNPEKNYFLSYNFRFSDNLSTLRDTSSNRLATLSNVLSHIGNQGHRYTEHKAKYIQQWHKKLQSILIFNQTYHHQSTDHRWDTRGLFIPGLYNQDAEYVSIVNEGSLPGKNRYLLARANYNINYQSKAHLFFRYESANQTFYSQSGSKEIIGEDILPYQSIKNLSGSSGFTFENIVAGGRYLTSDQINELSAGVDFQYITYQTSNNNPRNENRISPFLDVSRNINRVGRLGISYQFDFRIPTLTQLIPFYTANQFSNFSIGNVNIAPEQKNTFGVSLKKSNTIKGIAQNLNLMYSQTNHPVISSFEFKNNSFIETFYNSSVSKSDVSLHFIYSKMANKLRIFNHFLATYSHFYQRVQESESPFRQFAVSHRLTLTKEWEKTEIGLYLSTSVRNVPLNNQSSIWIYQPRINTEIKYFVDKRWSIIVNTEYNALISKNLTQTTFPLKTQIQYKTNNEKYKVNLIGHNIFGQTNQASTWVDVFSSSVTNHLVFPRYFYCSFTYVY